MVEDNLFEDTTGAGIVLANEPDWPEGPVPWNITIRRNRFLRGGTCLGYADSPHGAALAVRAAKLGHGLANAESIRDVVIEDNEIGDRAGSALFVGGATGVTVRRNRIVAGAQAELRRKGPVILLERSSGVILTDNTVSDPRLGTIAAVAIGANVAPGEAGVRISALETTLDKGARAIQDHRLPPRALDRP
ncbi:MAG TPA: right-handed parallel beta-helix repeat-containing protein [Verrucomicrobiota bacterium]|nr:right-handed parallel beta-helix repeat-containing protein [Verrucomicrobiota bacterium]HNU50741.1 right-handed parallel beta-helix repeat-containing protein [Verrucomicrobiota bacterium]